MTNFYFSVANAAVAERFGPNPVIRKDMLGSFLSHGLTREQLESETLTQMLVNPGQLLERFMLWINLQLQWLKCKLEAECQ